MPGAKKNVQSEPLASELNSDPRAKMDYQNSGLRKDGVASSVTSSFSGVKGGVVNKPTTEQGALYPLTSCYNNQYPVYNGTYSQLDGTSYSTSSASGYPVNSSYLYYMPSYNPYASENYMGVDGQQPYFASSNAMSYSWNSTSSLSAKSTTGSNGMKFNDYNSNRLMNTYTGITPSYQMDMKCRQVPTSSGSKSILQEQQIRSMNKFGSAYPSTALSKGYQQSSNYTSYAYQNQALFSNYSINYASGGKLWYEIDRFKKYTIGDLEELTRGPRAQTIKKPVEDEKSGPSLTQQKYNLDNFPTKYDNAKFYVIKSYSEDDVHKCIKYDVWSSTPNGSKKLDAAYRDAEGKAKIFLFFSVNGSGQFVGVAEMIGPIDYEKHMDFWQLGKWNGFFPVKWHIVKDVPNTMLRHIILENNDNRPVTYTRDTQEVGLKQGLEMLEIFKSYSSKTCLLDDLTFYEEREKSLKSKRISKAAFQLEKNQSAEWIIEEGLLSSNGLKDPKTKNNPSSLINMTRNLSLNCSTPKTSIGDKSAL